jgi:hypothetical protein
MKISLPVDLSWAFLLVCTSLATADTTEKVGEYGDLSRLEIGG